MRIAITEKFFDDISSLPKDTNKKCRDLLRELRAADAAHFFEQGLPGWRLHKLKSSPFRSASVDMQYRILMKMEGDTLFLHRVVKHDIADSPNVNRNDSAGGLCEMSGVQLRVVEVGKALEALGLNAGSLRALSAVQDEDGLLNVLAGLPDEWGQLALELYEVNDLQIKKARYVLIAHDLDLESALASSREDWQIYLHPSQTFVAKLPSDTRSVVYGSAGTGKTVCAWHRLVCLAREGLTVGFVCPSTAALDISRGVLSRLLDGGDTSCYFLVPQNARELIQIASKVDHLVIDEGQEFRPSWYFELAGAPDLAAKGLTVFADLNQILGTVQASASNRRQRYSELIDEWKNLLARRLRCIPLGLSVNYRNSKEIAAFYFDLLNRFLLVNITAEAPAFSAGDVVRCRAGNVDIAAQMVKHFLEQLKDDRDRHEVAVVSLLGGGGRKAILDLVGKENNSWGDSNSNKLVFSDVEHIRGHERRAVIALVPPIPEVIPNPRKVIDLYIALSRARDVLIVIEVGG